MNATFQPHFIAIVGGSGAGKTWLAEHLQQIFGEQATRLSLDDFYLDRSHLAPTRREKLNFDNPRAIDWPLVEEVLESCCQLQSSALPCYDFVTHTRQSRYTTLEPKPIVIMDGLWLLRRPSVRRFFGMRIFIECPALLRLRRRLERDTGNRGRNESAVVHQFFKTVSPMHDRYVAPQARWANLILPQPPQEKDIRSIADRLQLHLKIEETL